MKLFCSQRGLWGGPIFVNGNEYMVSSDGHTEVGDKDDLKKLKSCPGWREAPKAAARVAVAAKAAPAKAAAPAQPKAAPAKPRVAAKKER